MKSKKKQEELDKQRILILQTLEYLIEHYTGFFVLDDYDLSREYYLQEKNQVEKYYKERRLDQLKVKLAKFTHSLCCYKDIEYLHYIEVKTGYRINLYDEIGGRTEVPDVNNKKSKNQSEEESKTEKGLIYKLTSPNRKNWIALHTSGKNEFALTYLVVCVDGGNASVYSAKGENLIIKAYWENDSTILIETSNKYKTFDCYKKITTKFSNISIKYIDNSHFSSPSP